MPDNIIMVIFGGNLRGYIIAPGPGENEYRILNKGRQVATFTTPEHKHVINVQRSSAMESLPKNGN